MSITISNCITCDNTFLSDEDLKRRTYMCDGDGNVYVRTYNPFAATQFCGEFDDYTAETRIIDGVEHTGFMVTHDLGKLTALFLTVWNEAGIQVSATAEVIDQNIIFLITDGLESESGRFCIM